MGVDGQQPRGTWQGFGVWFTDSGEKILEFEYRDGDLPLTWKIHEHPEKNPREPNMWRCFLPAEHGNFPESGSRQALEAEQEREERGPNGWKQPDPQSSYRRSIWRFPEFGYPQIIHFSGIFSTSHPFWGTPILGTPPIWRCPIDFQVIEPGLSVSHFLGRSSLVISWIYK